MPPVFPPSPRCRLRALLLSRIRLAARLPSRRRGARHPRPNSPVGIDMSASTELSPAFRSIDLWGADAAYTWGSFTFRGGGRLCEGAPLQPRSAHAGRGSERAGAADRGRAEAVPSGVESVPIDLGQSFVTRDAVEWGVGADYTVAGYVLLVQVNQTDVLNNDVEPPDPRRRIAPAGQPAEELLARRSRSAAHRPARDRERLHVLLPRATYRLWEGLELRVGYLFIAGRESSVIGQYKRNDEGYAAPSLPVLRARAQRTLVARSTSRFSLAVADRSRLSCCFLPRARPARPWRARS